MRIGVVSDTHGNTQAFRRAVDVLGEIDVLVHAGDILYHPPRIGCTEGYDLMGIVEALNALPVPIIAARGNCDSEVYGELLSFPVQAPYAYASCEGARVLVNHGHIMKQDELAELGRKMDVHFIVSGHTHMPALERRDGVILMNPGSTSVPKLEVNGKLTPSAGLITDDLACILSLDDGSALMELAR
jgi:uncharacterized protein